MTVSPAPAEALLAEAQETRRQRAPRGTSGARAHGLAAITAVYLLWSLVPVAVVVLFSFNAGRSRSTWQGFSLRWYTWDPDGSVINDESIRNALTHTVLLAVIATAITVPLGVLFALALDRWRGRLPAGANFLALITFVIPEIALAIGLLFMVTYLATPFGLGTTAQIVGLVTFQLAYPIVICRARLLTISAHYEEAARDLGATALGAVRRVILPMLFPAILVSAILIFADVLDNFVIVRYLSSDASTETTSMRIYQVARAAPTPALNAMATIILVVSTLVIVVGWLLYRRWSKRQGESTDLISFTGNL
ncbi:MAG: polyamine ABC transporter permease [Actinobacteria bacterium]|nr:MAG: polyamine ABC transporter permease [Actinomycetota bacterium]